MSPKNYSIKNIELQLTLPLRHQVLKPFLPSMQETIVPGDQLPGTFHLGCYVGDDLVAVGSFMPETHPNFAGQKQFRLRQMATSPQHLRYGFGKAIIEHGIRFLQEQGIELLWFDAREKAFPFYEALGFSYASDFYQVPNTGPHKLMYKNILSR